MNEQARRYIPPNQVRYPADRQFASSCSPPRLATTQLLSASGSWLAPARTSTVLCVRLHGRTHSGVRRNPANGSAKPECTVEYLWIPGAALAGSPEMTASSHWLTFIANQVMLYRAESISAMLRVPTCAQKFLRPHPLRAQFRVPEAEQA